MTWEWHIEITKSIVERAGITGDTKVLIQAVTQPDKDRKRFPDRLYHTPFMPRGSRMRRTIRKELGTAISLLSQGNREGALSHLGYGFHALQDLTSHKSIFHSAFMHEPSRLVLKKFGMHVRSIDNYETMPEHDKERLDKEMMEYAAAFVKAEKRTQSKENAYRS